MATFDIPQMRLANQRISQNTCRTPEEVVAWMGALQAQDYLMSLWAVGLRTVDSTEHDVEEAIRKRKIVRTWPMRRTIHFVPAADALWMVRLSAERVIKTYAAHMPRLGLTNEHIRKSRHIVAGALAGGKRLTRDELYRLMGGAGIPTDQSRGIHILWRLGQEALVCFGPRRGKQQTFTLLEEWVTRHNEPSREEALADVARRYFRSHGPATAQDLAWWSGLKLSDVKAAIAAVRAELVEETIEGTVYYVGEPGAGEPAGASRPGKDAPSGKNAIFLLPSFDEYMLSYKDREAVIDPEHMAQVNRGLNGMYRPLIVAGGRIEGTWMRDLTKTSVDISPRAFTRFTRAQRQSITAAARSYGKFLGLKARVA